MIAEHMAKKMITGGLKGTRFSRIEPEFPPGLEGIGWYIHMPFCRRLCPYCSFRSVAYCEDMVAPYLRALKKEIDLYRDRLGVRRIGEVYFGGGTPSLTWRGVIEIADYLRSVFEVSGEIGMEANPEDLNGAVADALKEAGVRKISIGVQSFDGQTLSRMNRRYDADMVRGAIELLPDKGFYVSLDLLYSMPGQQMSLLMKDLAIAAEIGAHQICAYPFMLFPHTKWSREAGRGEIAPSSARMERRMYYRVCDFLETHGYTQKTCWDFANIEKSGGAYATCSRDENIGAGLSAYTKLGGLFYANTFHLREYIEAVDRGLPIATGSTMPEQRVMRRWFMMGLYGLKVEKGEFKNRFGRDVQEILGGFISMLKAMGLIRETRDSVEVTRRGRYWISLMTKTMMITFPGRYYEECLHHPWPDDFEM